MAKCQHCHKVKAVTEWSLNACAEGRRLRKLRLCNPCDIELNRLVLAFANVKGLDRIMTKYTANG